ncbi:Signal recognition particle 54 kDa protein 1 [Capsicum annuum]|nr:Signal recognition particle 54 kDa protein 1 [Capsicum annuum]
MVLAQLGGSISRALQQMSNATIIDEKVLNDCLNEITRALLQADVQFKLVRDMSTNIKKIVNLEDLAAGHNKRRIIQQPQLRLHPPLGRQQPQHPNDDQFPLSPAAATPSQHRNPPEPGQRWALVSGLVYKRNPAVYNELCKILDPGKPSFTLKKGKPSVVMFVGLQGSGKTTTCTKYAYHHQKKGWKPALVCADTFRAGAFDQLKQNATKAKIPFYGSYTESDPVKIAVDGVETFKKENCDLIIVDTSGRHKQEAALFEEMRQVSEATKPDLVIFVMDSSIGQAAFDQAQAFRQSVAVGAVIVTKMDGHAKGGGTLSAVAATKSPVIFIGTGEHMDEFEVFDVKPFVSRLLGMGDLSGLVNKIQDVVPMDQQPELLQKLSEGQFTLRIMYEQFQNMLKMGPLGQVFSMLPGFSAEMMPKGREKESQAKFKRYMTMMDSMTNEGNTNPKIMTESRIMRIARGSGRLVHEVMEMLEEYKRLAKIFSKMKGLKIPKKGDMSSLSRNMNAQNMSKVLPPQMLKQIGGMGGLQNLMKQMGSAKDMMGMFGGGGE